MGLPLLRIQNGGYEEQLIDGVTGFDLGAPSTEIRQEQIQLINRMRDYWAMPEKRFFEMANSARELAQYFADISYCDWLI